MLWELGVSYSHQKRWGKALDALEESHAISEEIGSRSGVSQVYWEIANVYEQTGDYVNAASAYGKSLDALALLVSNSRREGDIRHNLGRL